MQVYLLAAPAGFSSACVAINTLASSCAKSDGTDFVRIFRAVCAEVYNQQGNRSTGMASDSKLSGDTEGEQSCISSHTANTSILRFFSKKTTLPHQSWLRWNNVTNNYETVFLYKLYRFVSEKNTGGGLLVVVIFGLLCCLYAERESNCNRIVVYSMTETSRRRIWVI